MGDGQVTVPPGNSSNHAMLFGSTGFGITTHSNSMRFGNSPSTPNINIAPGDDEVKISNNKLKLNNSKGVWWGNFNITQSSHQLIIKRDGNNVAQFVKSGESVQHRIVHPGVNPGIVGYSNTHTGISIQPTGNTSQVHIFCNNTLMGRFSTAGVKIGDNGGPAQPAETLDVDGRAVVRGRMFANAFYTPIGPVPVKVSADFSAATEWQFNHNLGTRDLVLTIYDDGDRVITPGVADVSDPNTAYFYFETSRAGRVVIVG